MSDKDGMTLMEIVIVLIIIGIAAALAFPNFNTSIQQGNAKNAENNLLAIANAQSNYNNNNGSYCVNVLPNPQPSCAVAGDNCAGSLTDINCNLSLSISDAYSYSCSNTTLPYICTAVSPDNSTKWTLTGGKQASLTGANPACVGTYCPP